jgi:phage terminase small subunit
MRKLSDNQKKFCREYVVSLNATQAAVKAGYKHPNKVGHQNLVKLGIQEEISRLQANIEKKAKKNGKIIEPFELLESYTRDIMFDAGRLGLHNLNISKVDANMGYVKSPQVIKFIMIPKF